MKYTENYNLKKPENSDPVDIEDLNYNMDVIDEELKKTDEKIIPDYIPLSFEDNGDVAILTINVAYPERRAFVAEIPVKYNGWELVITLQNPQLITDSFILKLVKPFNLDTVIMHNITWISDEPEWDAEGPVTHYLQFKRVSGNWTVKLVKTTNIIVNPQDNLLDVSYIEDDDEITDVVYLCDLALSRNFSLSQIPAEPSARLDFRNIPNGPCSVVVKCRVSEGGDLYGYPANTVWLNGLAPVFEEEKEYILLFEKYNFGTPEKWYASWRGGWNLV